MILIVASRKDQPSMKMADKLLELYDFRGDGNSYLFKNFKLIFIDSLHIYTDFQNLDDDITSAVFLSKHSSSAAIQSLTVHPVGNFRKAELGGFDNVIVPSDPVNMSGALRYIKEKYNGDHFQVTFEATHHGPYLDKPAYFIEIGTTENEWN
ncbi:MAG: D-aminoacyl-tRNA deacylase, partial [Ferroplasma sp.]